MTENCEYVTANIVFRATLSADIIGSCHQESSRHLFARRLSRLSPVPPTIPAESQSVAPPESVFHFSARHSSRLSRRATRNGSLVWSSPPQGPPTIPIIERRMLKLDPTFCRNIISVPLSEFEIRPICPSSFVPRLISIPRALGLTSRPTFSTTSG